MLTYIEQKFREKTLSIYLKLRFFNIKMTPCIARRKKEIMKILDIVVQPRRIYTFNLLDLQIASSGLT